MKILLLAVMLCLFPNKAYADDVFAFAGSWSVHPKLTMEYSKNSPKYNPSQDAQFEKTLLRMVNTMTVTLSEDKMIYRMGARSSTIPFEIKETTATSTVVSGDLENTNFTLIFTMIDGQYMNFKSSGSDDMDYYIWQKTSSKPVTKTGPN